MLKNLFKRISILLKITCDYMSSMMLLFQWLIYRTIPEFKMFVVLQSIAPQFPFVEPFPVLLFAFVAPI